MSLHIIGLGLADEKDISLRGLETIKSCKYLYLESYTSLLQSSISDLEKLYGKAITIADRDLVEKQADTMLDQAKDSDVGFLVVGDALCATTHIDLMLRAKERNIPVSVVHNASIISAVGAVGLEVYKYGKITSIPFHNKDVKTPIDVFESNQQMGLHTLFLLDLDPISKKFLSIADASTYLIEKGITGDILSIGCARIGAKDQIIHAGSLKSLNSIDFGDAPYCLIIPGNMHFMEEDALALWKE